MADYLDLIANLNSDSPVSRSMSSPEDFAADLSLWTNAEFTFDTTPGLGIFESDSGFSDLLSTNTVAPPAPITASIDQDSLTNFDIMNITPERPLSLLERTRQRNPLDQSTALAPVAPALSILQASQYSSSNATSFPIAPTTPAAAKLLRQPLPQYQPPGLISKPPSPVPSVSAVPSQSPSLSSSITSTPVIVNATVTSDTTVEPSPSSVLGEKRKGSTEDATGSDEETEPTTKDDDEYHTKLAAEEDKRRRNTAASARFRQKKKLREQALEQTAREQTLRAEQLKNRVRELEMEVRWLRGLIVDKDTRLQAATMTLQQLDAFM
ncbi:hypothetical protein FBU30_010171 [Linnemannia zychae]|nr:hypothetical protein FBU30_010171 [Linnemannia zychae]